MQKFVTIALHCHSARHGAIEEHLVEFLAAGWCIASVTALGTSQGADSGMVWLAVVLEQGSSPGQDPALVAQMAQAGFNPFFPLVEFPQTDEGKPVEPSDIPVGPDTYLEVGSRVLAYSQGRWWRAEVVGLEPGDLVKIHFPGWDAKWDQLVPREELQVDLHSTDE